MHYDIGQSIPIGLREIWNCRIDDRLDIHHVLNVGNSGETMPQRVRDERLPEGAQKEFQRASYHVNVDHG